MNLVFCNTFPPVAKVLHLGKNTPNNTEFYPIFDNNFSKFHGVCGFSVEKYKVSHLSQKREMELETFEKLASQMEKYEVLKIIFNGGEPTVRKDFIKILQVFYQHEIPIEIATNGVDLSIEKIEIFNQYNVVGYTLSIEGKDSKTHDFIRGPGSFNKVLTCISNLKKYSNAFAIDVEVTYGRHNLSQVEDIINLLSQLGVTSVKYARLKPWNWGKTLAHLIPSKEDIIKLNDQLENLRAKYNGINISGDVPQFNKALKIAGCNITTGFEIQPDGNVLPCRIFEQKLSGSISLGNTNNNTIYEIWNNHRSQQIRQNVKTLYSQFLCSRCKFSFYCATNYCIAENYLKFGRFIPSKKDLRKCKV